IMYKNFFFQAEDGIRDRNVTGVQTCALPISAKQIRLPISSKRFYLSKKQALCCKNTWIGSIRNKQFIKRCLWLVFSHWTAFFVRSEERRVGKECRCGLATERE